MASLKPHWWQLHLRQRVLYAPLLLRSTSSIELTFSRVPTDDLRDALAGCIGGILSIASTNTRLHISVPEKRWFRIRKVSGTPGAIVSTSGTDVDIDIGELRFGERKDLLVEVEMSFAGSGDAFASRQLREERERERDVAPPAINSATDAYFLKVGLNPASLDDYDPANLYDDEYDSMPDEVPLFEVSRVRCVRQRERRLTRRIALRRSTPPIAIPPRARPSHDSTTHLVSSPSPSCHLLPPTLQTNDPHLFPSPHPKSFEGEWNSSPVTCCLVLYSS